MTLRDLRVQTFKERKEGKLTKLPSNFYTRTKNLEGQIKGLISKSLNNFSVSLLRIYLFFWNVFYIRKQDLRLN